MGPETEKLTEAPSQYQYLKIRPVENLISHVNPEVEINVSADELILAARELPRLLGVYVLIGAGSTRAVDKLRQPRLSRRDFLGATTLAGLAAVVGLTAEGCGGSTQPAAEPGGPEPEPKATVEKIKWDQLTPRQQIIAMETGLALDADLQEFDQLEYSYQLEQTLRHALDLVYADRPDIGMDQVIPVTSNKYLEHYRAESRRGNETLDELRVDQNAAFASERDQKVYLWVGADSPLVMFKGDRKKGLDPYVIAHRLTVTHEAAHLIRVSLTGEQIPDYLAYMQTQYGLAAVDEILGFALLGYYPDENGEIDQENPFSMTAVEEAATELINRERTKDAGLYYTDITNYGSGVALLNEILSRTSMGWQELETIKGTMGLPGLLEAWEEKTGLNKPQISMVIQLLINTTMGQQPTESALSQLDQVLPKQ